MDSFSIWFSLGMFFTLLLENSCVSPDHLEGNPLAVVPCSQEVTERRLYVSTIDGVLIALDEHGQTLWSYYMSEPLFSSSLSRVEYGEVPHMIIPGLDRGLYHWNGHKLTQLPFSADDLIDHSHHNGRRGSFLLGAKANNVVGINIENGKPVYECTHQRCHRYDNQSFIQQMDLLKLSISWVKVREANDRTGEEMWNFTVGDVHLMLIEGEESTGHSCNLFQELKWELRVDTLTGMIYAADRSNLEKHLWELKLGAPVVKAWLHDGGKLEPVILSHTQEKVHPSLVMVVYNNQYYLQPVEQTTLNAAASNEEDRGRGLQERISIVNPRHYSLAKQLGVDSRSSESMSSLMLFYDKDIFIEMCTEGPYGLAVYFYMNPLPHQDCTASGEENESGDASQKDYGEPSDFSSHNENSNQQHWVILKLLSVIQYIIFGAFVLTCNKIRRYLKHQRQRNNSNGSSDSLENDEFPLLDQIVDTIRRHSSLTDSATTPTIHTPSLANNSTETLVSLNRSDSVLEPRIMARFGSDYELKGRLGKGGFGVVYHVQNKTDGGEYAVKRIKLPSNKGAREKVMREVRALAQLDHPRIVRYFISWVEKAPVGLDDTEEWTTLSRRPSCTQELTSSSVPPSTSAPPSNSSSLLPPLPLGSKSGHSNNISPCPSFSSLNHSAIHSVLPPALSIDSRSSSFIIEFRDENNDSQSNNDSRSPANNIIDTRYKNSRESHVTGLSSHSMSSVHGPVGGENNSGCFSRALLSNRDDLSSTFSTEDKEEKRDSIADLGLDPPTYLFIQMQLCQKETLKDWLKKHITERSHDKVIQIFEQILDAVMYVHDKGMMHRDLKPSNIFFSLGGEIKVGDFGLVTSSVYGGLQNSYLTLKGLGDDQHRQHTGNLGSHFYMSPEQVSGKRYNKKVDIFSLGVIFFELHYPFLTDMERAKVLEDVRKHKFPLNFEIRLPHEAEFVKWLMAHHPSDRPTVKDIHSSDIYKLLQNSVMETIPKL